MLFEFPQGDIERHDSAESWMAARPNRLNASETAALWGRSRYASRYSLHQDKAHGAAREAEESTHMRRGKIFEGPIIDETRFRYGWELEQWDQHASVVHPALPVACTPDCLIVDDEGTGDLGRIILESERMHKTRPSRTRLPKRLPIWKRKTLRRQKRKTPWSRSSRKQRPKTSKPRMTSQTPTKTSL